jgi:hypothetical protein
MSRMPWPPHRKSFEGYDVYIDANVDKVSQTSLSADISELGGKVIYLLSNALLAMSVLKFLESSVSDSISFPGRKSMEQARVRGCGYSTTITTGRFPSVQVSSIIELLSRLCCFQLLLGRLGVFARARGPCYKRGRNKQTLKAWKRRVGLPTCERSHPVIIHLTANVARWLM